MRRLSVRYVLVVAAIGLADTAALGATRGFTTNTMTAAQVVPPPQAGASVASGHCTATVEDQTGRVSFSGTFAGLNAPATGAALYGPAGANAGPAPVLIPSTTLTPSTSGTFVGSGTITPDLVSAMIAGLTYCGVRDAPNFAAGEIRGQLVQGPSVPALPDWTVASLVLVLAGTGGALVGKRQRRVRWFARAIAVGGGAR